MRFKLNASGGKGSAYRPVDKKAYDETWDRVFGKDKKNSKENKNKHKKKKWGAV